MGPPDVKAYCRSFNDKVSSVYYGLRKISPDIGGKRPADTERRIKRRSHFLHLGLSSALLLIEGLPSDGEVSPSRTVARLRQTQDNFYFIAGTG